MTDETSSVGSFEESLLAKGPVLAKLGQAFQHVRNSTKDGPNALLPGSVHLIAEPRDASTSSLGVHVGWIPARSELVLAWNMFTTDFNAIETSKLIKPAWLTELNPKAAVLEYFHSNFQHVLHNAAVHVGTGNNTAAAQQKLTVVDAIDQVRQGATPRRITAVGFCMSGALANIGIPWLARSFPTADLRCITFGAPRVGNDQFNTTFKWLCALSYRCIYRRDPIPDKPRRMKDTYKPVAGSLFLHDNGVEAQGTSKARKVRKQRGAGEAMQDHSADRYVKAMSQGKEGLAGLGKRQAAMVGLVDVNVAKEVKGLNNFSSWAPQADGKADFAHVKGEHAAPKVIEHTVEDAQADPAGGAVNGAKPPTPQRSTSARTGLALIPKFLTHSQAKEEEAQNAWEAAEETDTDAVNSKSQQRFKTSDLWEHVKDDSGSACPAGATHEERRDRAYGMFQTLLENAVPELLEVPGEESTAQAAAAGQRAPAAVDSVAVRQEQLPANASEVDDYAQQAAASLQAMAAADGVKFAPSTGPAATIHQHNSYTPAARDAAPESWNGEEAESRSSSMTRQLSVLEEQEEEVMHVEADKIGGVAKLVLAGKIRQAAICATAAYLDSAGFKAATGIMNSELVDDKVVDTKVHVGWLDSGTAIFAFRGTQSRQDAMQDLKALRRPLEFLPNQFPGAKAHLGFLQQFAAVTDPAQPELHIGEVLQRLSKGQPVTRILCCGHSLGGALACLGATWAALSWPDADVRCITFGSPRCGNAKFARAFSTLVGTSYRVVFGADPVPSVPPPYRYRHVNNVMYFRNNDVRLYDRPWHHILRPIVSDHFMDRYHKTIGKHLPWAKKTETERTMIDTAPEGLTQMFSSGCMPALTVNL